MGATPGAKLARTAAVYFMFGSGEPGTPGPDHAMLQQQCSSALWEVVRDEFVALFYQETFVDRFLVNGGSRTHDGVTWIADSLRTSLRGSGLAKWRYTTRATSLQALENEKPGEHAGGGAAGEDHPYDGRLRTTWAAYSAQCSKKYHKYQLFAKTTFATLPT